MIDLVGARARRQLICVDGQEPDRPEWDAECDQRRRGEKGDPAGPPDHELGQAVPESRFSRAGVAIGGTLKPLRREGVHPRSQQRQYRRQNDQRKRGGNERDQRACDSHRAQEVLGEHGERRDRGGHRQRTVSDRPAGGCERPAERLGAEAGATGLLAIAGDREQAVVDGQPEPEAGDDVKGEHR